MRDRGAAGTPPSESSWPIHSRSKKQIPQGAREAWHSGENHPSLRPTAVNLCVAMYRGHSSMKVVASLFISFLHFHFYGFSFLSFVQ